MISYKQNNNSTYRSSGGRFGLERRRRVDDIGSGNSDLSLSGYGIGIRMGRSEFDTVFSADGKYAVLIVVAGSLVVVVVVVVVVGLGVVVGGAVTL